MNLSLFFESLIFIEKVVGHFSFSVSLGVMMSRLVKRVLESQIASSFNHDLAHIQMTFSGCIKKRSLASNLVGVVRVGCIDFLLPFLYSNL